MREFRHYYGLVNRNNVFYIVKIEINYHKMLKKCIKVGKYSVK